MTLPLTSNAPREAASFNFLGEKESVQEISAFYKDIYGQFCLREEYILRRAREMLQEEGDVESIKVNKSFFQFFSLVLFFSGQEHGFAIIEKLFEFFYVKFKHENRPVLCIDSLFDGAFLVECHSEDLLKKTFDRTQLNTAFKDLENNITSDFIRNWNNRQRNSFSLLSLEETRLGSSFFSQFHEEECFRFYRGIRCDFDFNRKVFDKFTQEVSAGFQEIKEENEGDEVCNIFYLIIKAGHQHILYTGCLEQFWNRQTKSVCFCLYHTNDSRPLRWNMALAGYQDGKLWEKSEADFRNFAKALESCVCISDSCLTKKKDTWKDYLGIDQAPPFLVWFQKSVQDDHLEVVESDEFDLDDLPNGLIQGITFCYVKQRIQRNDIVTHADLLLSS